MIFHRINGYIIILLLCVSNAGIFMIARHVAGGSPHTQAMVGVLSTITTISISLAYYNIKRLQIDQHRAWMLRTWVYCGSIISLRFVLKAAMQISYKMDDLYDSQPCVTIYYGYAAFGVPDAQNPTTLLYPSCGENASASTAYTAVPTDSETPEGIAAAYNLCFGMAAFIALVIHAISVEVYLHLTPAETERLRQVSRQRQEDAKFKNPRYEGPGYEGLTAGRSGDADTAYSGK